MDFKTFLVRKILMGFFVSVTCICAAVAILGLLFEPDASFGYEVLFFPLIYGAVGMFPSLVTYSKKELSFKKALVRNILHLILLEIVILLILHSGGALKSFGLTISIVASILIVALTTHFVLWINDMRLAKSFNAALKIMQQKEENKVNLCES